MGKPLAEIDSIIDRIEWRQEKGIYGKEMSPLLQEACIVKALIMAIEELTEILKQGVKP